MTKFDIPYKLTKAINDDKLLIFIGAGVSKIAGLPLWKEVVIKTLQNPAIKKGPHFISALEQEVITPLEALDKIEGANKKEVFNCFEEETSKLISHDIYRIIKTISSRLITTNYDKLIEHNTQIKVINTSSSFNLQKIDEINDFLLKIHGDCSEIDNATIFTSDYERLYSDVHGLAKFQLEKLVSSYTCLFIGFSLSDNYVTNLFENLNKLYDGLGREHYVVSTDEIDHDFVETIKINEHSDLHQLLDELASAKKNSIDAITTISKSEIPACDQECIQLLKMDENLLPEEGIVIHPGNDTPPIIEHWTGRNEELKSITSQHKICFITGIGGQGKSALASRLLTEADRSEYKFIDWRDFKEENLNFQSKLFQLIELVSNGKIRTSDLVGHEIEYLLDIFFNNLGTQKGIFVFDNIDKYIDLERFTPAGDMDLFFNKALKISHQSKFVFTCRPFIHFAGIGFYQVQLVGLEFDDVKELIKKYHINIGSTELHHLAIRLHAATKGHPLWMGLILAQSKSQIGPIDEILKKIATHHESKSDSNISGIISEIILKNVWAGLKEREKVVLRTLSISSIAEKEEDLAKIVEKKINFNQFSKALKALKSLNLIVAKEGIGYIELHPLVREFIKINYAKEQQESYIALYVSYLDGFIVLMKNKLGKVLGSEDLELIIKKIEILINTDKMQEAINELRTTNDSFQISGYCEEFIRLSDLILRKNIWTYKKISKLRGFFEFIENFFVRAADFGCYDIFEQHMDEYKKIFTSADVNMILAKSVICHKEWSRGNYFESIKEGKSASDLIDILGESDTWSGKHRYNLALRDSREIINVEKALKHFCNGKSLNEYIYSNTCDPATSSIYGNIGRCLLYLDQQEIALLLTIKSYKSLNDDQISFFNKHNIGYAAKWIGEILATQQKVQESLYFILHSRNTWKSDLPAESNRLDLLVSKLPITTSNESIINLESWQISKFCNDWVESHYERYKNRLESERLVSTLETKGGSIALN